MNRFTSWLRDWDWRPLVRLFVWIGLSAAALRYYRVPLPDPAALLRELILGWLVTFGLHTYLLALGLMGSVRLYLALDEWTYWAAEKLVLPWMESKPFAVTFLATFTAQLALVAGCCTVWCWIWT